jgi:hypothetical protein
MGPPESFPESAMAGGAPCMIARWISSRPVLSPHKGTRETVGPAPAVPTPTPSWQPQFSLWQELVPHPEGRAAVEMVGEFLPLLDL